MRSGPGAARTILLFHIISARPSKQPLMVRTFLKVYMELGSYFLFLQEQIKDIIITGLVVTTKTGDTSGDNNDSVELASLLNSTWGQLSHSSVVALQT